jgi:hypothetical protein
MPNPNLSMLWKPVWQTCIFLVKCWIFSVIFCLIFIQFWERYQLLHGVKQPDMQQSNYEEMVQRSFALMKQQEENVARETRILEQRERQLGIKR